MPPPPPLLLSLLLLLPLPATTTAAQQAAAGALPTTPSPPLHPAGASPPPPPPPSLAECRTRMDLWCNVPSNNPSVSHNPSCGPKPQKFYALNATGSSTYGPHASSAWRCYGAIGLTPNHTAYLGTSKCYSSETAQLEWQLCACQHCAKAAHTCNKPCGKQPPPRGFPPVPGPPAPPLPPGPPSLPITNTPLFVPCEDNRTGFRIPALLSVGNSTLYAFAESRTGTIRRARR